jgi:hypothetical protein
MAEFNLDAFLDNVLRGKSNQELAMIERAPAAQKEKVTEISGSGSFEPIEYPDAYNVMVPQSDIISQNINPAIE